MDKLRVLEVILLLISLMAAVSGTFWFLDTRHAHEAETAKLIYENDRDDRIVEFELKSELLDRDIKKDAEARVYYKDIELEQASIGEPLGEAEQRRLNYLEDQLEQKYKDQDLINKTLIELKNKD